MPDKKQGLTGAHEGHRQRMKERFLTGGLESFSGHEILEMLLFYALPYRNTNDLGHQLEKQFGGWTRVLDADYADLVQVPGVTPHVATLLTLCGQMAHRYQRELTGQVRQLYNADLVAEYVIPWFLGKKDESVVLVSMDNKRKLLNATRIFEGSVNSAQFNVRLAVQQALRDNATQVVLAHNHPNGYSFPSEADVSTTRYVAGVLAPLDIRLVDHIIVAEGDCLCMSLLPETAWVFRDDAMPPEELAQVADQ